MVYNNFEILKKLRDKANTQKLSTLDSLEMRALKDELWKIPAPSSVFYESSYEKAEEILQNGWSEPIIRCYTSACNILGNRSFTYQNSLVWLRIDLSHLKLVNIYTVPYTPGDWSTPQERSLWENGNFPNDVEGWYRPGDVVVLRSSSARKYCGNVILGAKRKL